jgi:hypothetical protein
LRFGYTLAALDEMARVAVWGGSWSWVPDYRESFEAARSAIAERLYASREPPARGELVAAGIAGVGELIRADRRHRGRSRDHEQDHSPSFERYWQVFARPTPGPEERIVEQAALRQIMAALPYGYRTTLITLADHGDYDRAAAALGISRRAFTSRVSDARQAFRRLWHEGEQPSPMWGRECARVSVRRNSVAATIKKRGWLKRQQAQQEPASASVRTDAAHATRG